MGTCVMNEEDSKAFISGMKPFYNSDAHNKLLGWRRRCSKRRSSIEKTVMERMNRKSRVSFFCFNFVGYG